MFQLDNYELRKGKHLKVNISVANLRLFVGNIPKSKSKQEIFEEFKKITEGKNSLLFWAGKLLVCFVNFTWFLGLYIMNVQVDGGVNPM